MNKFVKDSIFILLAGLVAILGATFIWVSSQKQYARDTKDTTAIVTKYVEENDYDDEEDYDDDDMAYYPVLTYKADGKTIESQYSQSDDQPEQSYKIGEKVKIKYNPDDPEEFVIPADRSNLSGAMWVIPVGALLILYGLGRLLVLVYFYVEQE